MRKVESETLGFVGYVPKTDNLEKDIIAASKLIDDKHIELNIPKIVCSKEMLIYNQANYFLQISLDIFNGKMTSDDKAKFIAGLVPFIVNGAFTIELFLKCLLQKSGKTWPKTHTLITLFHRLPKELKDKISKYSIQNTNINYEGLDKSLKFIKYLEVVNKSFVEWRYFYEKNNHIHLETGILLLILDVLNIITNEEMRTKNVE